MVTGYLLQDFPNPNFGQFGWPRTRVSGVIGVHTTESGVIPAGPDGGAENTAAWIRRRPDPGGYHVLADADSIIKLVHPRWAAWADTTNNAHAMSVSGAMNAARWRDLTPARAAAIVRNMGIAAAGVVRDAMAAGLLAAPVPARRITAAEAIAGSRPGFYGHGETNPGRRYDPGTNFDWDLFLASYAAAIGGTITPQGDTEEDDMATPEEIWAHPIQLEEGGEEFPAWDVLKFARINAGAAAKDAEAAKWNSDTAARESAGAHKEATNAKNYAKAGADAMAQLAVAGGAPQADVTAILDALAERLKD